MTALAASFLPRPAGPVGLGDGQDDLVARLEEGGEGGEGGLGAAEEDDAHQDLLLSAALRNFFLIRFRLSGERQIDEQLAVEMVDLVAESPGQQVGRLDLDRAAVEVEPPDDDLLRPGDFFIDLGNGQAALLADDLRLP